MIVSSKDFNGLHLLVTPRQNKKLPVYRWYHFTHSFSRDLVWYLINKFRLNPPCKIFDPFCGSGTTLLAAKQKGISAIGIDILPLSVFISNAKLQKYDSKNIEHRAKELDYHLKDNANHEVKIPKIQILHKVFDEETLFDIFSVRNWIQEIEDEKLRYFFLTALLSSVDKVAYANKGGGFLRMAPDKDIPYFKEVFYAKIGEMLADVEHDGLFNAVKSNAFLGDARKICFPDDSFDAVITSPPYLNRHDYTRVYILELAIGFSKSDDEIKELRYKTLRSHVEARKIHFDEEYTEHPTLRDIINKLFEGPLPNRKIIPMIAGYFEDMHLVLREVGRVTKTGGFVAFVIGNVRYGGILIPVDEILAEMGDSLGLVPQETITARVRGNSPQQMNRFGRVFSEENILIWKKS